MGFVTRSEIITHTFVGQCDQCVLKLMLHWATADHS